MSDDGIASRLPWLPSDSHAKSDGGGPADPMTRSIVRRISASATTEIIALICAGGSSNWCRPTRVGVSRRAARRSSSTSLASAIARRSTNGVRVSAASRSRSLITPSTSPRADTTGRWRIP